MKKFVSNSPEDTQRFARNLVKTLKPGSVLGLTGELGAGKTTLVQGLAQGLGIKAPVTSPTFTLMNIYPVRSRASNGVNTATQGNFETLVHIDCYRLQDETEFTEIGALDYINDPQSLVVIEWADKIKKYLAADTQFITLTLGQSENQRVIKM